LADCTVCRAWLRLENRSSAAQEAPVQSLARMTQNAQSSWPSCTVDLAWLADHQIASALLVQVLIWILQRSLNRLKDQFIVWQVMPLT
jgi:hypothetical protein